MDTDLRPAFLLPPSAEVLAEEAAAAGVELTAVEFFPVVVILGMMVGASAWLRPSVEAQTHQHHSLLYRAVTWPARRLTQAVTVIEHRVMHAMSKWLAPKVGMVAHALNSVTHEVHVLTQVLADTADNTHEALTWLRHQVIPELISDALKPLRKGLATVEDEIAAVNTRLHTAAVEISDQLAGIGKAVGQTFTAAIGQLAVTVVELWNFVHKTLVPQVEELIKVTIPALETAVQTLTTTVTETIPKELTAIRDRIGKLEDYIVSAAFIAAVVLAVEKAFSWLTCRNMKQFGNQACAAEELTMDALLLLMFGALALADIRELTKLASAVEGEFVKLASEVLVP